MRRNVYITDKYWNMLREQAAEETASLGVTISVSHWISMLAELHERTRIKAEVSAQESNT